MTDRAQPGAQGSTLRNVEIGETAQAATSHFIVPSDDPTNSAKRWSSLDETSFNEFNASYSNSSTDVTIDPGEAYIDGWLATDTSTTVSLSDFDDNQTVILTWNADAVYDDTVHNSREEADEVVIKREQDLTIDNIPYMPLWEFDTDGTGVTSAIDRRRIGRPGSQSNPYESFHADALEATESITGTGLNIAAAPSDTKYLSHTSSDGSESKSRKSYIDGYTADGTPTTILQNLQQGEVIVAGQTNGGDYFTDKLNAATSTDIDIIQSTNRASPAPRSYGRDKAALTISLSDSGTEYNIGVINHEIQIAAP